MSNAFKHCAFVLATICALFGAERQATAEGFLDIYAGGTFTNSPWNDGFDFGVRGGYFFNGPVNWLGVGGDLSYIRVNFPNNQEEFDLIPVTPMLFLRIPIFVNKVHPGGRIQPYVSVGPAFTVSLVTDGDITFNTLVGFDVGIDARAGVAVQLARTFGLFAEYRYMGVSINMEDTFGNQFDFGTVKTNHVNAGIALRF